MTKERTALYRDVFVVNLEPIDRPARIRSRAAPLPRLGLEQRLGDDRALIESLRKDIEAMQKKLRRRYAYVHGVRDVEKPLDLQVTCAAIRCASATPCRAASSPCSARDA
jgi:hypothetical protein